MPLVQNPSIGAGAAALLVSTTQLTSAQILALGSTPVTLIPAPGAGKLIFPLNIMAVFNFGTVAYSAAAGEGLIPAYATSEDGITRTSIQGLVTSANSAMAFPPIDSFGIDNILPGDDNDAIQLFANKPYNVGPILTTTLGAGGLGYAANDTGTIQGDSGDATYKVLTVGAGGAVLTYQITNPGTLYTVRNGATTATGGAQPGVGVGFTVNITAVQTGDGTLKVITYYQIITVP